MSCSEGNFRIWAFHVKRKFSMDNSFPSHLSCTVMLWVLFLFMDFLLSVSNIMLATQIVKYMAFHFVMLTAKWMTRSIKKKSQKYIELILNLLQDFNRKGDITLNETQSYIF
jgi:hypothetical protein